MWIYLGLLSALFLGIYNICKKHSVSNNAVLPVLCLSTFTSFLVSSPLLIASRLELEYIRHSTFYIPSLSIELHLLIFIKSAIISSSWLLAFHALKHLPLTIVAPIRSAGPFFTLIGAVFLFQERPNPKQWLGLIIVLLSVFLYSYVGKKEGIQFRKNKWIHAIILATLLGSSSGLYDKFLIQDHQLNAQSVLTWFSFYSCLIFTSIFFIIRKPQTPHDFRWRWSIPAVGVLYV
ncbi:DMT family transporter [Lentisphaera profundi]|uniref:DMT family transporter n=1 Tax=Lentisphaera profundi TaxID=1658616 RepID=A0ABY7VU38_9BACT|nr:DMT family transporter [Lentisphaera profundi]WDE95638.1 DMT family transporter [Lentisphaera profundi]